MGYMKNFYSQAASVLIICLTLPFQGFGQDYHPMPTTQAVWNIARCWSFYPGGWYDEYSIVLDGSDTLINGHVYKKLNLVTHHLPGTQHDSTYSNFLGGMRESNRKVFFVSEYLCIDTIERMVYDFNPAEPGDTIYSQVLTNGLTQFIPHIVTSIDLIDVDGTDRRRINLRNEEDTQYESWIEGIGSDLGLTYASYWLLTDNSYDLICFKEENKVLYKNDDPSFFFCLAPLPEVECDSTTTSTNYINHSGDLALFPNPAFDLVTIRSFAEYHQIDIINATGEILLSITDQKEMNLSNLPPGMYYVLCTDKYGGLLQAQRLIKL